MAARRALVQMPDDEAFEVSDDLVRAVAAAISPAPSDKDVVAARRALEAAGPTIFAAGLHDGLKAAETEIHLMELDRLDALCEVPPGKIRDEVQVEFNVLRKALKEIRALIDAPNG